MSQSVNLQSHPVLPAGTRIWLLAGQSNMQGCGDLCEAPRPDPAVWAFTSAGRWESAREPLIKLWESFTPVNQTLLRQNLPADKASLNDEALAKLLQARTTGVGPGLFFAQAIREVLGCPVGLINAAHGGTTLEQWSPAKKDEGVHSLYGAMLERIKRSAARIEGILWYQGESDARMDYPACGSEISAAASSYAVRFADWVESVRTDLDRPDLPVIAVQIGNTTFPKVSPFDWNEVRWQQYRLPEKIPHLALTATLDLPLNDIFHLASSAQNRLGRRLARLYLALTHNKGWSTGPRVRELRRLPNRPDGCGETLILFDGVTGGWQNAANAGGFTLLGPDERPAADNLIFYVYPDPNDRNALRLRTNLPPKQGDKIAYGYGRRPICSLVDHEDMPCPAFLKPLPV